MTLAFHPLSVGMKTGLVTVTGNAGATVASVSAMLSGNGVGPHLAITPTGDFGGVTLGSTPGRTFTVVNDGSAATSEMTLALTSGTQFFINAGSSCNGATLAPGAPCSLGVTFRPTATGTHTDTLTVQAGAISATLPLSGVGLAGVVLGISPTSAIFGNAGNVELGLTDKRTFTIQNSGALASPPLVLAIQSAMMVPDFRLGLNNCMGATLASGASCTADVIFAPTALGVTRTGTLAVTGTPQGSASAGLTGTGVASTWSTIDVGGPMNGFFNPSGGVFEVRGSGADVYGMTDQFRFAYRSVTGNCTLVARVLTVQNTNTWAKAPATPTASRPAPPTMAVPAASPAAPASCRSTCG
jgi:hypothetical protein